MFRSVSLLSREARRFRNLGTARYEARDLARRMDIARMAVERDEWEKAKIFKDPAEQLWVPFLVLACFPIAVACAHLPGEVTKFTKFLNKSEKITNTILPFEDLETERVIQEYRDSIPENEADHFIKPELWGQD